MEALERMLLQLPVAIRLAREPDLELLEWFGAMRAHRRVIQEAYARQLAGENWMLVAEVRGFPVGQLWIDLQKKPDAAVLWAFRVMPPFLGLGIGGRLMETAEQLVGVRGSPGELEIGAELWNREVLRLYERYGYRMVGKELSSYVTEDETGRSFEHRLELQVLRKAVRRGGTRA
jgi:GNAT superfamily N-acetyltransferase